MDAYDPLVTELQHLGEVSLYTPNAKYGYDLAILRKHVHDFYYYYLRICSGNRTDTILLGDYNRAVGILQMLDTFLRRGPQHYG